MKTIIQINNQDAVPIRAIPYITGWKFSPDKLLLGLAHQEMPIKIEGLFAFSISSEGDVVKILPKEWDNIYAVNKNLSSLLSRNQFNSDEGYATWIIESIKLLPAACFVWKDEFEEKFNNAYATWSLQILEEREGDRELNFSPLVPVELESVVMEGFKTSITSESSLSVRTENNYLKLIMALSNGIAGFNPKRPHEAAQLIINETGIENISAQTIANYLSKAHEIQVKNQN
jgi:hypothetical protein